MATFTPFTPSVEAPSGLTGSQARSPNAAAKRAKERVRVSRACDRCKRKKIRCTGKKPCSLCSRIGVPCEFNARYTRGRLPAIEVEESENSSSTNYQQHGVIPNPDSLDDEQDISYTAPTTDPGTQIDGDQLPTQFDAPATPVSDEADAENIATAHDMRNMLSSNQGTESAAQSSRNSPEPSQTDLQGHYVGPSSGVSFLLRAQKRLHKIVSLSPNSSIFTFGDAPLPEFDSSFFVLPPKEKARALVARYFDFAVPTHRFLHRPTVEGWLEELYCNLGGIGQERPGERGKRAVTFMVFAQALEYMPKDFDSRDSSARYFQAAEQQLRTETGEIRLTSVQARLCQCFYLLSESRINHCWSLFGTTAHLVLALGIHRKLRRRDMSSSCDMIDVECRKRVFWSAYTLDNYLSAALGRPRTFHDDDIDQELPGLLDDSQLTSTMIGPSTNKTQNIMLAPIYHARLAQIISGILKDLYGIRPLRAEIRNSLAKKHTDELLRWRQGIAHFLDVEASLLNMLFQRQSNVLRLAYAHAIILVHRPFLLSNFADLTRRSYLSKTSNKQLRTEESVTECLKAAISIVEIVSDLCEGGQNFRAFWFTHYYAFCAVVVLYVYTIQRRADPPSTWKPYFSAAEKCQHQISTFKGEKDSFAQRYSIVLEELRLEAIKQTQNEANFRLSNQLSIESAMSGNNPATTATQNNDRDQDTEVAHTILRLSDNNQPDSYNMQNDENQQVQSHLPAVAVMRPHQSIGSGYDAFNSMQQSIVTGSGPFAYSPSLGGASTGSMMGDSTGWGEFDSFVTAGIGGLDGQYFSGMDSMGTVDRWDFSLGSRMNRVNVI